MIIFLHDGGQLIFGECPWIPAAYVAAGNQRGSQGVMLQPKEIDAAIAELTRIRALIDERESPKQRRRKAA
jgi:hypothetical protein